MARSVFITIKMLEDSNACYEQIELFKETFGTKAKLCEENIKKAYSSGLDVDFIFDIFPGLSAESALDELWKQEYDNRLKRRNSSFDVYCAEDFIEIDLPRILRYVEDQRK